MHLKGWNEPASPDKLDASNDAQATEQVIYPIILTLLKWLVFATLQYFFRYVNQV